MTTSIKPPPRVGDQPDSGLLTRPVQEILDTLHRVCEPQRQTLLQERRQLADRLRDGAELGLLPQTEGVRSDHTWRISPPPDDLTRRTVELAGPATAAQAAVARRSGADTWVADLEDMLVPTWERLTEAHHAIGDYIRHTGPRAPTLIVRPRGLHLQESHLLIEGGAVSASLVDTVLFVAHQARALQDRGSAPYLYLPKLEHHHEAAWWDHMLSRLEHLLDLPRHTIRVSVLVETVAAAYQLEEILHTLRHRVTALTAGRYDYVFSYLRAYADRPDHVLPDRGSLTMSTRFLRAYTDLVVATAHRRGAHAIGGPVAQVPWGAPDDATHRAQARVRRDKARQAAEGFDGAWVLHPALVPVARQAFAHRRPDHHGEPWPTTPAVPDPRLLADASGLSGGVTLAGLRTNLRLSLRYLSGWLGGQGSYEIEGHLEDFGTVELARLQLWQWAHHGVRLAEGPTVTNMLVRRVLEEEVAILRRRRSQPDGRIDLAARLLWESVETTRPPAFLSARAYAVLLARETASQNVPAA